MKPRHPGLAIAWLLCLVGLAPGIAHADDDAAWLKDRQARYAAYHAAHPNPDAEIALIKAETARLIAESTAHPRYGDLFVRSAALTPAERAQAAKAFFAAFKLWQAGEYAAAKEGFIEGLAIDPANGMANFYLGDILTREGDKPGAAMAMDKAATLAPGTAEAFKAKAALKQLPAIDPLLDLPPVIWKVSKTPLALWDGPDYPEMVVVPAGDATLHTDQDPKFHHTINAVPRHRVRVGYPFAVSKYPITVGDFARFVDDAHYQARNDCVFHETNGSVVHKLDNIWRSPGFDQGIRNPVVCVSWEDGRAYAAWLSRKTGHTYRLLSEAEYEYADRGGATTNYWWGDQVGVDHANCGDCGSQWDHKSSSPVGSFPGNPFGLYDTTGNVGSWISDCLEKQYGSEITLVSDNMDGNCALPMARGGLYQIDLEAHFRAKGIANEHDHLFGFRIARTL